MVHRRHRPCFLGGKPNSRELPAGGFDVGHIAEGEGQPAIRRHVRVSGASV